MNEAETERWLTLVNEDKTATSTKFVADLNALDVSRYILQQNYADALQIPNAIENNTEFAVTSNQQQQWILHREFIRRLHNYLAAAKTLVDQVRSLRRRWTDEDFQDQYGRKLAELLGEPAIKFIQDLRRLVQHSSLPPIQRVTTVEPVPPGPNTVNLRTRYMVPASELLILLDWSEQAREYISAATDDGRIDIPLTVKRYHERAVAFDAWCIEEIKKRRSDLVQDFGRRRAEIAQLTQSPNAISRSEGWGPNGGEVGS